MTLLAERFSAEAGEFFFATIAGSLEARLGAGSLGAVLGLTRGSGAPKGFSCSGKEGSGSNDTLMESCGADVSLGLGHANKRNAITCRAREAAKNRARGLLISTTKPILPGREKGSNRSFAFAMGHDVVFESEVR